MDNLIADAQLKHLISFNTLHRSIILYNIYGVTKDMTKLNPIDLQIYWADYVLARGDYAGVIFDEEK
jgi:hypothetical protein